MASALIAYDAHHRTREKLSVLQTVKAVTTKTEVPIVTVAPEGSVGFTPRSPNFPTHYPLKRDGLVWFYDQHSCPMQQEYYLETRASPIKPKCRDVYVLPGLPCETRFVACANTIENLRCAILERVMFHKVGDVFARPPQPNDAEVLTLLKGFKRAFKMKGRKCTPDERHKYVNATYRGRRLKIYLNALANLDRGGVSKKHANIKGFMKFEKQMLMLAKRLVPRMIQPASPEYNIELGCYVHKAEHIVYRTIDKIFGAPSVMKGLNAFEQGRLFSEAWATYSDPCALLIDASRCDQHIRRALLKFEHGVYLWMFDNCPILRMLLRWQLCNNGFVRVEDILIKYRIFGGRCSGHMNTAVGNVLVVCAVVHAFLESEGVLKKVRVFDAGDDCCLMGEKPVMQRLSLSLSAFFDKFGLVMKVEPLVTVLEQISFCQTNPVYDGVKWRMVRDPRVTFTKDATILYKHHLLHLTDYTQCIGDCGLALTGGIPLCQDYYKCMGGRSGVGASTTDEQLQGSGFFRLARGMREHYRPVTVDARVSFTRAFGIMPDQQINLEAYLSTLQLPVDGGTLVQEVQRVAFGLGVQWGN